MQILRHKNKVYNSPLWTSSHMLGKTASLWCLVLVRKGKWPLIAKP